MQKIKFGKTGMQLTKIGFGGIPIQRLSTGEAVSLVRFALDSGINWLDTANGYSNSEERIGLALQGRDRASFKIFSKAAGKTPEELRRQVELSFSRLGLEVIDLYQFHLVPSLEVWRQMHDNGTVALLKEYQRQGRIRHIGASAHVLEVALALAADPDLETFQWPFNFVVIEEGLKVLEACRRHNLGFIAMKPFSGGIADNAAACIKFQMQYPDVVAGAEGAEFATAVAHACTAITDFFERRHRLWHLVQAEERRQSRRRGLRREAWCDQRRRLREAMAGLLRRGVAAGKLRADLPLDGLAVLLLGMLRSNVRAPGDEPAMDAIQVARLFLEGAGQGEVA